MTNNCPYSTLLNDILNWRNISFGTSSNFLPKNNSGCSPAKQEESHLKFCANIPISPIPSTSAEIFCSIDFDGVIPLQVPTKISNYHTTIAKYWKLTTQYGSKYSIREIKHAKRPEVNIDIMRQGNDIISSLLLIS